MKLQQENIYYLIYIHKITIDLLYLLHFGVKASEKDYEDCMLLYRCC